MIRVPAAELLNHSASQHVRRIAELGQKPDDTRSGTRTVAILHLNEQCRVVSPQRLGGALEDV